MLPREIVTTEGGGVPPLVSVIIPCYRQAQYLRAAVDSVLAQTYSPVEIIVVNDGSDDHTEAVAKSYGDRIQYVWQTNAGLSAARNAGFAVAHGEYIQFLDADDLIAPAKIQRQLETLAADPTATICLSDYQLVDLDSGAQLPHPTHRGRPRENVLEDFLFRWETDLIIPIHTALFRRSVWDATPPFDVRLPSREDWVMWVAVCVRGARFCYLDAVAATYRKHRASMSANPTVAITSTIDVVKAIRPYLAPHQAAPFEEHIWELCNNCLRAFVLPSVPDYRASFRRAESELNRTQRQLGRALADLARIRATRWWRLRSYLGRVRNTVLARQGPRVSL